MQTSLTGIKPSGTPHLGNYLGAIRPALALREEYRTLYFIADYHALTVIRDADAMQRYVYDVAATWLACGLDAEQTILYRQSDVIEVFELQWVLSCILATGQLERGHAFKDALSRGESPNAGIFNYPVLMAADILLYDTDVVPVGQDQRQHLELARDAATRLNHLFGEATLIVPEPRISEAPLVPGTDGRKMGRSYGNSIPLFAPAKELRSVVMRIQTSSEPLEAPKEPSGNVVFELYRHIASESEVRAMEEALRAGGYGWGHAKQALYEVLEREIAPMRERFEALRSDTDALDRVLTGGAERARSIARNTIRRVRQATGIARIPTRSLRRSSNRAPSST